MGAVIINAISDHPDFQGSMHGLDPCRMAFEPKDNKEPSYKSFRFRKSVMLRKYWFSANDRRLNLKVHEDSKGPVGLYGRDWIDKST